MADHPLVGTVLRSPGGGGGGGVEYEVERVAVESSFGRLVEFAYMRRLSGGASLAPPGTRKRVDVEALRRYRVIGRTERSGSHTSGDDHA